MALGLPHSSGLCDSAGATAGMASLAACSTGADTLVRPYTVRHWVEWRAVGKGAKVGWKAGRRLESLPHIGHDTEDTEKNKPRRRRRWGEKGGGGLRWSAQSCGPRRQSWGGLAIGTPVLLGIV